jgi:hypothetical protein
MVEQHGDSGPRLIGTPQPGAKGLLRQYRHNIHSAASFRRSPEGRLAGTIGLTRRCRFTECGGSVMTDAETRLAAIGFSRRRPEPTCWRHVRLDASRRRGGQNLAHSAALQRWLDRLTQEPLPPAYRISRIA